MFLQLKSNGTVINTNQINYIDQARNCYKVYLSQYISPICISKDEYQSISKYLNLENEATKKQYETLLGKNLDNELSISL